MSYLCFVLPCLWFVLKMQHFKDVEIATVKMEEKAKSQKEIEQLRRDMERTYEMKAEALIKREKNAIERLQKQQEVELFTKKLLFI